MKYKAVLRAISFIELFIGLITLFSLIIYFSLSISQKPLNVFIFVLISSLISILIGIGLLNYREWARRLLIFFAAYIVLTKILIFSNLLQLSGEIITFIPASLKDSISILYHSLIIVLLSRIDIKANFVKR